MPNNYSEFVTPAWQFLTGGTGAAPHPGIPHTLTGEFRHHENFAATHLGNARTLIVYLPPGYATDTERRYPVLYMQDGQNLFDRATAFGGSEWQLDETAQQLITTGKLAPLIIVGLYNTGAERINEYTPSLDARHNAGGKADLYGHFLLTEVKPFIDRRYRTLPDAAHTGLGGSSLGGLVSLYLGLKYPQFFSRLLVMSPSVWWDHGMILRTVDSLLVKPALRIWLDMGAREGAFSLHQARLLRDRFLQQGWRLNADLKYREARGGRHTENDWAKRAGSALQFLYGKE